MSHLSMSTHDGEIKVMFPESDPPLPEYAVCLYIGSAFSSLYMTVEEARKLAEDILAGLPAVEISEVSA